jgi:hypothetical protein
LSKLNLLGTNFSTETLVFLELVFILNRLFTYAGQSVTKDFPGTLFFPLTIKLTDCHLLFKWKSVKSGVKHNLIDLSLLKADNFHWQLILVYAVEASSMAEQAESIVQENKLSDRIKNLFKMKTSSRKTSVSEGSNFLAVIL